MLCAPQRTAKLEPLLLGEANCVGSVLGRRTLHEHGRMMVDVGVPHLARLLVVQVVRRYRRARQGSLSASTPSIVWVMIPSIDN